MNKAIAIIELQSIVRGWSTADAMVKKAPVRLEDIGVVSPGKYLILVSGDVASVEEAFLAGMECAADCLLDRLFLPRPHDDILAWLDGSLSPPDMDALGLIEVFSAAASVRAADVSLKAADVSLLELRFRKHLGGKGYLVFTGEQHDVEAALEAGCAEVAQDGLLARRELIARPHADLIQRLKEG